MRLFGSHWPKLTSLELLDHFYRNTKTSSVLSTYMLPGITHLCHSQGSCGGQASSILKLFACPSVTHLDLGHHLFGSEKTGACFRLGLRCCERDPRKFQQC